MSATPTQTEAAKAREVLWSDASEHSPEYAQAVRVICSAVENGAIDLAGVAAEALAFDGPHHDAARAYVYYYVAYSQEGYSVAWANEVDEPNHYLGPVGDFRNEAIVSDLVEELGIAALPALDFRAAELLRHGL
jgi:hypothetical protein